MTRTPRQPHNGGVEEYTEAVLGRTYLSFHYLQISMPLLSAAAYVNAGSSLGAGLASVMRPPATTRTAQIGLHLDCVRRIRRALEAGEIDDARAFLLVNMVATDLPLTDEERHTLQLQLEEQGDTALKATELTWADQLLLQGREEGREEALREAILRLTRSRFGRTTATLEQIVQTTTREEELLAFFDRTLAARSEAELLSVPPMQRE